jgi:hypothetical protein
MKAALARHVLGGGGARAIVVVPILECELDRVVDRSVATL